jgi:SanA protein
MKLIKRLIIIGLLLTICFVMFANYRINKSTEQKVFDCADSISFNKVGLLLGTSKFLKSGQANLYFQYRIDAAVELFNSGKIEYLVISGDNSRKEYNEPLDMKEELAKKGIPAENIHLDYAGFRTYDSVYRLRDIFGQESFTVISQRFHNQRAIYIAKRLGMEAIGYNAKNVDSYSGFKTNTREKFARVKVFIDLLINKKPKFLGEKIEI